MYLAHKRIKNKTHYYIRQTYCDDGCLKSRELCDLGTDPSRFIIYPGGKGYYYDSDLLERLTEQGVDADQESLDPIFYDFLDPEIQRVIIGFDRGRERKHHPGGCPKQSLSSQPHLFDKRRLHFLRFGSQCRAYTDRMAQKVYRPLFNKSRDELEQYFLTSENILKPQEKALYVSAIFDLTRFAPKTFSSRTLLTQIDDFFMSQLCTLNADQQFWAGVPSFNGLHDYLIKYAIMYFDYQVPRRPEWQSYIEDFVGRHRKYRPPAKIQARIAEAEKLFGLSWQALKQLDRESLSRKYRKMAHKHHPDKGGNPKAFDRLTEYYQTLLKRKMR